MWRAVIVDVCVPPCPQAGMRLSGRAAARPVSFTSVAPAATLSSRKCSALKAWNSLWVRHEWAISTMPPAGDKNKGSIHVSCFNFLQGWWRRPPWARLESSLQPLPPGRGNSSNTLICHFLIFHLYLYWCVSLTCLCRCVTGSYHLHRRSTAYR